MIEEGITIKRDFHSELAKDVYAMNPDNSQSNQGNKSYNTESELNYGRRNFLFGTVPNAAKVTGAYFLVEAIDKLLLPYDALAKRRKTARTRKPAKKRKTARTGGVSVKEYKNDEFIDD